MLKLLQIQFCHRRKWGPDTVKSQFFNGVQCSRRTHTCTGIMACEYLHPSLRSMKITNIGPETWEQLNRYGVQDWDEGSKKRDALRFVLVLDYS